MPSAAISQETRLRLLDSAGEAFARHGFERATVRDICRTAGANVAAINYHFGGKDGLYRAAFLHHYQRGLDRYPPDLGVRPTDPPEHRLAAFVRSFFLRMFADDEPEWFAPLMLREMVQPTGALDELLDQHMLRMRGLLTGLVGELLGRKSDDRRVYHACCSIVGQIVFHKHCAPLIRRMWPQFGVAPREVAQLADHVTAFTLAGLREMRPGGRRAPARRRRVGTS